jgi:hypothetical protein
VFDPFSPKLLDQTWKAAFAKRMILDAALMELQLLR